MAKKSNAAAVVEEPSVWNGLEQLRPLLVPLAGLTLDPQNARKHDARNLDAIRSSLSKFGQHRAAVAQKKPDGTLLVRIGNGMVEAARSMGWTRLAVLVTDEDDAHAVARGLVDNRAGELATWDESVLAGLLTQMPFDLALVSGFDSGEIEELAKKVHVDEHRRNAPGEGDPDDVPEPPIEPTTKPGDLWLLGPHRLLCGDSTKAEDVARLMGGEKAVLMATDPPFGVGYANDERPNPGVAKPRVANDDLVDGPALQAFLESMIRAAQPHMDERAAYYLWHPMLTQGTFFAAAAAAAAADILIHRQIIWVKPVLLLGRGDYHWRHELCFYGWRRGFRPPFYGARDQDTIWEVAGVSRVERKEMNHATPKPVALWDRPIANHTLAGQVLYEPFAGSGTQIVAAERAKRRCFAIELDVSNCDVAVRRWERQTGSKAERRNA